MTVDCKIFTFSSFKTEINQTFKYNQFTIQRSKVKVEIICLLGLFIALGLFITEITGLLFCTTQKV